LAVEVGPDGGLQLHHEHETDGRGLDLDRSLKVLEYVHRVWRRPVTLNTVDARGATKTLTHPVAA
jgi:stage V sporulation protein R